MNACIDYVLLCPKYHSPHPHFPFLFLPSSQEFIPYSLTANKFFLISFKDKSLLIGCRWIMFPSNLQGDNWTGKKEFWHLIHYGHLLCQADPGLLVKMCAWTHQVIHLSRSALWASVVEGVTLPSTSLVYMDNAGVWVILQFAICIPQIGFVPLLDYRILEVRDCGLLVHSETLHTGQRDG